MMRTLVHESPVGPLALVSDGAALVGCYFEGRLPPRVGAAVVEGRDAVLDLARRELDAFFDLRLKKFTVHVAPRGTDFQRRVWQALCTIPYGATSTYGSIAQRIGSPAAVRAVGAANGANPVSIVIPCHRVIGADGSLTGFGGGLARKRLLLSLERQQEAAR